MSLGETSSQHCYHGYLLLPCWECVDLPGFVAASCLLLVWLLRCTDQPRVQFAVTGFEKIMMLHVDQPVNTQVDDLDLRGSGIY